MAKGKLKLVGMSASEYQAKYAKPFIGSKSTPRSEWYAELGGKSHKKLSGR